MLKRSVGPILISIFFLSALGMAIPAHGAEVFSRVQGKVLLEKRTTIVPLVDGVEATAICRPVAPCSHPSTYWSFVVLDGMTKYELVHPFASGQANRPEFVEINGVAIRPGSEVEVEGTVEVLSPTYGVISEVTNIRLVRGFQMNLPQDMGTSAFWKLDQSGWECHGPDAAVSARIWYGKNSPNEDEAFHFSISMNQAFADIGRVQIKRTQGSVIYSAQALAAEAVLMIQHDTQRIRDFPSILMLSRGFPFTGNLQMACSPSWVPSGF